MSKNRNLVNTVAVEGVLQVPTGTTAQRPASAAVGYIRYNTTLGFLEQYTGDGWQGIAPPPTISTVSPTTYNGEQGTSFTINGSNFDSTVTVKFITSQGAEYSAATVSRINNSQVTATTPQDFTVADEPLKVKVVNGSGLSYTLDNAIDCGGSPTWTSTSGNIATYYYPANTAYSTSILATDPDAGATITYSIASGLPSGATLNTSTGSITGSITDPGASIVTNTFTAVATDNAGNTSSRSFNIIRKWQDGSAQDQAATSATAIKTLTGTGGSGMFWLKPAGWTYPAQFYCEMGLNGGGWIYILQRQCYSTGTANSSLPGSWLTSQTGTQNHASTNFSGVVDSNGAAKTPQDIWNAFIGSGNNGKWYAREIQTGNGSYDESQRYVGSSDNAIFSWTNFARHFSGNYSNGSWVSGVRVYYNNGSNYVDGKLSTTWSAPSLATINNGNSDQDLWFCNGTDNYDSNWGFGLMKGGTPFPATADGTNGGARRTNNITRWGIIAIKA